MKVFNVIGFRRIGCEDTELIQLAVVRVYEVGNEPVGSPKVLFSGPSWNIVYYFELKSWSNERQSFVYGRSCLGVGPDILTEDSSSLPQSLTNVGLVPPLKLRPLPCTSLPFHFSVI
jgi:hypothetical protein